MLTKTTLSAIRSLTYLGLGGHAQPVSPRTMAEQLGESPTYLAKVLRELVKAGILRAHRGVSGGVVLNRAAQEITMREIVEVCQGTILGDFCTETSDLASARALHQATAELHQAVVGVLSRWTLADFLRKPHPSAGSNVGAACWLEPCRRPRPQPDGESPAEMVESSP